MQLIPLILGLLVLAIAWIGPLPDLAARSFAAHMTMHMTVVAVAAPLMAFGLAGTRLDPARARPQLFAPIPASFVELLIVWGWHAPALHHAARRETWALVLEQASFITAGLFLWLAVVGGRPEQRRYRGPAGAVALLFTFMHMTLLGALFALTNRPLFLHGSDATLRLPPLTDQHLGGVIMLLVGGASYLAGALWLTARVVRDAPHAAPARLTTTSAPNPQRETS
jgi:putative membrane protein